MKKMVRNILCPKATIERLWPRRTISAPEDIHIAADFNQ